MLGLDSMITPQEFRLRLVLNHAIEYRSNLCGPSIKSRAPLSCDARLSGARPRDRDQKSKFTKGKIGSPKMSPPSVMMLMIPIWRP